MSTSDFNLSGDIFCDRRQRRLFGQALAFVQVSHHIGELEESLATRKGIVKAPGGANCTGRLSVPRLSRAFEFRALDRLETAAQLAILADALTKPPV